MTISTQSSALFPTLDGRLARNAEWAESIQSHTLDYFKDLVKGQQPEILWFGCKSHSYLPAPAKFDAMPSS
jgi:carbonic anhydrase